MLYPYTTEAYNTLIRTLGFGTASGIGRIGSAFAPYILIHLYYENESLPFLSFFIAALIASLLAITLPFDTTGLKLDGFNRFLHLLHHYQPRNRVAK
jgi:hypothetical protein